MKRLFPLILFLCILGCETNKKKKVDQPVVKQPEKEVVVKEKIEKVGPTLFTLERKPCSGDCPVFSVTVTKDRILTYHGKEYTNIEGVHTLTLSKSQFEKFNEILKNAQFSQLNSRYATSGTSDFPESVLKYDGKEITVRLWKDAPKELTAVYVFVEDILYNQKYLQ